MAKKTFAKDLEEKKFLTVLNHTKEEKKNPASVVTKQEEKKNPDKPKYKTRNLKIRSDVWEKAQIVAWWNRQSMQEFFTAALEGRIDSISEKEFEEMKAKYKKK